MLLDTAFGMQLRFPLLLQRVFLALMLLGRIVRPAPCVVSGRCVFVGLPHGAVSPQRWV